MAASTNREKCITRALNSANGANILDGEDSDDIQDLICEYFLEETDIGAGEDDDSGEETEFDDNKGESDEEGDHEGGLLVVVPEVDHVCSNFETLNRDTDLAKVQAFDCKCFHPYCHVLASSSEVGQGQDDSFHAGASHMHTHTHTGKCCK